MEALLREAWSPEPVSGSLRRTGELASSHETICRQVWRDRERGESLHLHLRCAQKPCRKRDGRQDSRGRLAGKRLIGERPAAVEGRRQPGPWASDTVLGQSLGESRDCILPLVERKSGDVHFGRLRALSFVETADRQAGGLHGGADQWADAVVDETASWEVPDDHWGQRDGVPRICGAGEAERSKVLLCDPASCLGARK